MGLALYSPSISVLFGFPKQDKPFDFDLLDTFDVFTFKSGVSLETDASPLGTSMLKPFSLGISTLILVLALYSSSISVSFGFPKQDVPFDFGFSDVLVVFISKSGASTVTDASPLGTSMLKPFSLGVSTSIVLALYSPS